MTKEENDRQYRVLDQMISMHMHIAQSKRSQSFLLKFGLFFASVITCGFTFADDNTIRSLGIGSGRERLVMGLVSLVLFGLSLVELLVDWDGKARAHEDAAKRLSLLKSKYRQVDEFRSDERAANWVELSKEYSEVLTSITEIPERSFLQLKAHHLFKIELSREITKNPGAPVIFLKLMVRARAFSMYKSSKQSIN